MRSKVMIDLEDRSRMPQTCTATLGVGRDAGGSFADAADVLDLHAWRAALIGDLDRSIAVGRWPTGLRGVAWIHLLCFLGCQVIYDPAVLRDLRHPLLWVVEFVGVWLFLRRVLGPGWFRSSPAINLVAKLWISFLILSFNVVSLNSLTGFELSWYKPVWGTLSAFLFASLAWLFTPLFFIPAVQMGVTGLLMVQWPHSGYLIYGVSWWLTLTAIAARLRRRAAVRGS
jgi:hypothetical protein